MVVDSSSAQFFINGRKYINSFYSGEDSVNGIFLGKGRWGIQALDDIYLDYYTDMYPVGTENYLSGDISALLIYSGDHDYKTRSSIENWIKESFDLPGEIIGLTEANDVYLDVYTEYYEVTNLS